ncbi:MAG: DUF3800 domain-containing protein [Desulfovibrionaceae bacterium]|nr:DUF3800 domain-containing protein [Desulfovibrionaceae bacterium]
MTPKNGRYVFVDESGDTSIHTQKKGVSNYYVATAIIVEGNQLEEVRNNSKKIINLNFQNNVMKSSRIGNDVKKRKKLLQELSNLKFTYYSIVINKNLLNKKCGLQFKRSYYKYILNMLYEKIYKSFSDIKIKADNYGGEKFMRSFREYFRKKQEKNYNMSLVSSINFEFLDDQDCPLIQLADLISGTILRVYEKKDNRDILKFVDKNKISIVNWPPYRHKKMLEDEVDNIEEYNYVIRDYCFESVSEYIYQNSSNGEKQLNVEFLSYLIDNYMKNPKKYVSTNSILSKLRIGKRIFRTNIIAKLRDEGIILSSSSHGYKIPYTLSDLNDFVSMVDKLVVPRLKRLKNARDQINLLTNNSIDIVAQNNYSELSEIINLNIF